MRGKYFFLAAALMSGCYAPQKLNFDGGQSPEAVGFDICGYFQSAMISDDVKSLYVESVDLGAKESSYSGVDLDLDGVQEKINIGSGSSGSWLQIQFSSDGKTVDYENGFMRLLKIQGKYYVLSTLWETSGAAGVVKERHLLSLSGKEVKSICTI